MAAIQGDWYASAGAPNEAYPERDGTVRFVYADQPNGDRYIVAKVWAGDDQDYESTARLVAAAPALLAALRFIAGQSYETQAADVIDHARQVLANAEGGR